jgi:acyl-CoA synthetase (AMP-forming)/AMP-acid ligase II
MLSHRNLVANCRTAVVEGNVVESDVYLLTAPLCHLAAGARIFFAVHAAATLWVEPEFDPERVVQLMHDRRVSSTILVPTMVQALVGELERSGRRARDFRRLTYGAAPIPLPLLERVMELLPCEFQHGYGLTEASATVTVLPPSDHVLDASARARRRVESVGRAAAGVEVKVVDDDGREVMPGEQGEVIVRGANVMEGYWRRPSETAAAIRDGWLFTGDVGVLDDDGYLYLVDRKADLLISGGINVYPREIEVQLEAHPEVRQVAVVGEAHARWGEVPVAFVVAQTTEAALVDWCRTRLAAYKVPKRVVFLEALPRNASGKVDKRELRQRIADRSARPSS